jgi:hypothetical protein
MERIMTYEIIDYHFHPAVDEQTDTSWFYPSGSMQHQIDTLRRAGISQACGAPVKVFTPGSFDEIRLLNDKVLALQDEFPDCYVPAIQVHPHFPDESCREIERCCGGEGVGWIGEQRAKKSRCFPPERSGLGEESVYLYIKYHAYYTPKATNQKLSNNQAKKKWYTASINFQTTMS